MSNNSPVKTAALAAYEKQEQQQQETRRRQQEAMMQNAVNVAASLFGGRWEASASVDDEDVCFLRESAGEEAVILYVRFAERGFVFYPTLICDTCGELYEFYREVTDLPSLGWALSHSSPCPSCQQEKAGGIEADVRLLHEVAHQVAREMSGNDKRAAQALAAAADGLAAYFDLDIAGGG